MYGKPQLSFVHAFRGNLSVGHVKIFQHVNMSRHNVDSSSYHLNMSMCHVISLNNDLLCKKNMRISQDSLLIC
jgi:hypothetical protein